MNVRLLGCVFRAMWMHRLIMARRYAFNTLSSMITIYLVFLLLFLGGRALAGPMLLGDGLEGLVVGYLVWMFALFAYSDLAWELIMQAQIGTLEKLFLSPAGFRWVTIFNELGGLVFNFGLGSLMLLAIMLTTGTFLRIDLVSVIPLLLATIAAAYGFGLMAGGLALVHKRIQAAFQILQFVFVGFIMAPGDWVVSRYLPFNLGTRLLGQVMGDGVRIWQLPASDLLVLVATGAAYLALGMLVFARMERMARNRGLLGHY
ncbi:MAG TPA: ABC transporter [Clostridiales bacterium]|nr:ABC transporter [Clostridiales bacterium]